MSVSLQPFRQTLRRLIRSPLYTIMAVLTLALGIGGNTAVFSVINGVLLRPLSFENPERLVGVCHTVPGMNIERSLQSPALHFTYRERNRSLEDIGMWFETAMTITDLAEPLRVGGIRLTDGTLSLLGIKPFLGRTFTLEDGILGGEETVIVSHGFWQSHLGADQAELGRSLTVDGIPRTIVGVLPAGLSFLDKDPEVFLPFRFAPEDVFFGNFSFHAVARLKTGVTIDQATQDLARLVPIAATSYSLPDGLSREAIESSGLAPVVVPLKQEVVGDVGEILWVLFGAVGLVLLIACANVANLFLVRAEARQKEMAVRAALGASRYDLARYYLGESIILTLAGGMSGLWMAWWGTRLLAAIGPEHLPRLEEVNIDPAVLLFTLGVSIAAGLLFGLVPAFRSRESSSMIAIKESGRGADSGRERRHTRSALVVAQVAIALVLLVGSGLMIRSFLALRQVDPGFDRPEEVQTLRLAIPPAATSTEIESVRIHEEILKDLAQIPGVDSVGASTAVPMDGSDLKDAVYVQDFPMQGDRIPDLRRYEWILPGFHETLNVELLAGRTIGWSDIQDLTRVVVISESLARCYWDSPEQAIGKNLREAPSSPWRQVVGVVADVRAKGIDQDAPPTIYWPMAVEGFWGNEIWVPRRMAYVIRTPRVGTMSLMNEVREAVWSVNPNLPLANVSSLDSFIHRSMARTSFTLTMLAIAAVVALLLGAIGIYGVISYTVSLRTREFGIRMALGARRCDVSGMVVRHSLVLAGVGIALGLAAAVALTRLMSTLLYGISATDPLTYALVAAALVGVAAVASYLPAWRASRIDPITALR